MAILSVFRRLKWILAYFAFFTPWFCTKQCLLISKLNWPVWQIFLTLHLTFLHTLKFRPQLLPNFPHGILTAKVLQFFPHCKLFHTANFSTLQIFSHCKSFPHNHCKSFPLLLAYYLNLAITQFYFLKIISILPNQHFIILRRHVDIYAYVHL